jgi:hypothetical protein
MEIFSDNATLTINGIPTPPDATGSAACVSPSTVTLTASGAADGDYRWYDVVSGGSILGTSGSFTTPSIAATKTFYVSISDTFCESERVPVDAMIALLSKPALTSSKSIINGNVDICDGDNCTLTAPPGFKAYTWSTGANGKELVVGQSGSYTVVVKDINDCVSPASDPITVTENLYPVATITINGVDLTTSPGDSYQWYENGNVISGAIGQSLEFNVLEYGTYAVDVTENGCTTTSNSFEYLITDVEQFTSGLKVYPNPARGDVLSIESAQAGTITILDATGKLVHRADVQRGTVNSISLNKIARGTYLVRIYAGEVTRYIRLVRE